MTRPTHSCRASRRRTSCALGACRGSDELAACIAEGLAAGAGIALPPPVRSASGLALRDAVAGADARSIVDPQNDVTAGDIRLAVQEGFRAIEHIKRYTTTGMATDQGKIANMVALAVVGRRAGAGDSRGRGHHLPRAVHAGEFRHLCRAASRPSV